MSKVEEVGKVFMTNDYDEFKFDSSNRFINERRAKMILASFKTNGRYNTPILVREDSTDGKKVILDGQHRFTACKLGGLPVIFTYDRIDNINAGITEITKPDQVAVVNQATAWNTTDHLNSKANSGSKDAEYLLKVCKDYNIKTGLGISIVFGNVLNKIAIANANFPKYDKTQSTIVLKKLSKVFKKHKLFKNQWFVATLRWYMLDPTFDFSYLVNYISTHSDNFTSCSCEGDAQRVLRTVFSSAGNKKYSVIINQWALNAAKLKEQTLA